jgi:hypothetical protein
MTACHSLDVESACVGGRIGSTTRLHEERQRDARVCGEDLGEIRTHARNTILCGPV